MSLTPLVFYNSLLVRVAGVFLKKGSTVLEVLFKKQYWNCIKNTFLEPEPEPLDSSRPYVRMEEGPC